jgi:hypothetical protein
LRIHPLLSPVGSSQANHSNALASKSDDGNVQPSIDRTEHPHALLSILGACVFDPDGPLRVHVSVAFEANATRFPISDTLGFVEFELHDYIVSTIKSRRPVAQHAATMNVAVVAANAEPSHRRTLNIGRREFVWAER